MIFLNANTLGSHGQMSGWRSVVNLLSVLSGDMFVSCTGQGNMSSRDHEMTFCCMRFDTLPKHVGRVQFMSFELLKVL